MGHKTEFVQINYWVLLWMLYWEHLSDFGKSLILIWFDKIVQLNYQTEVSEAIEETGIQNDTSKYK